MGRYPLVHVAKLSLAETAVARYLVPLALLCSAWILEVDGFQVVFVSVAPRKNAQCVAAVVAVRPVFERAPELSIVGTNLLPVTFEMAEQVVGSGKASVAELAHMRPRRGL